MLNLIRLDLGSPIKPGGRTTRGGGGDTHLKSWTIQGSLVTLNSSTNRIGECNSAILHTELCYACGFLQKSVSHREGQLVSKTIWIPGVLLVCHFRSQGHISLQINLTRAHSHRIWSDRVSRLSGGTHRWVAAFLWVLQSSPSLTAHSYEPVPARPWSPALLVLQSSHSVTTHSL